MNKGHYYYVTIGTDQEGYHLLHRKECKRMPLKEDMVFIGTLYNLNQALATARDHGIRMPMLDPEPGTPGIA